MHILVPSRGRPENVATQIHCVNSTVQDESTRFVYCIDSDDPSFTNYAQLIAAARCEHTHRFYMEVCEPGIHISGILNSVSEQCAKLDDVGFMGDDHLPRTNGWDTSINDVLRSSPSIVYGNDLIQGKNLPTQVFISGSIIRTLGYMVPETLYHLYLDNFWRDLGERANVLTYLDNIIIEHMHPIAKKSVWDEGYARVNTAAMYERDAAAYEDYRTMNLPYAAYMIREMVARG